MKALFSPSGRTALAVLALILLVALLYLATGDFKRGLQLTVFIFPFIGIRLAALGSRLEKPALLLAASGVVLACADAGIRLFLRRVYTAEPMSTFVLEAVANTSTQEALEFAKTLWSEILLWGGLAACVCALGVFLFLRCRTGEPMARRSLRIGWRILLLLLTTAAILSFAKSSWRSHYPLWFWPHWQEAVSTLQSEWMNAKRERTTELSLAEGLITRAETAPRTLVLVIGESTTRTNWSLYGYARSTTPKLEAFAHSDRRLQVFSEAWSVDAATVGAFHSMFTFPLEESGIALRESGVLRDGMDSGNLFAFFHAAGWRIHWISNQDDIAINTQYAGWADKTVFLNRMSGRTSVSLDGSVLAPFAAALQDPAPKKLIVVHLIGAHPHYALRYPASFAPDWGDDQISKHLKKLGRYPWVIISRNQYDAAMRYQDEVLCQLLTTTRENALLTGTPTDWLFLSDHGQETGDFINRAGHSTQTPSGFRIPLLFWSSDDAPHMAVNRPFRADGLSPLLLSLAGIHWLREKPAENFASRDYRWRRPAISAHDPALPPSEK